MAILVLGNGFDLAHGLPTKYSQFLDFVQMLRDYDKYLTNEKVIASNDVLRQACYGFIKNVYHPNSPYTELYEELRGYSEKSNLLLSHFLQVYHERCRLGRDGWIDFEAEIADVVQLFDKARSESMILKSQGKKCVLSPHILSQIKPFIMLNRPGESGNLIGKEIQPELIEEQAERVNKELTKITRLFEIYLLEIVSRQTVEKRIKQLDDLHIDKVLSFNYTDTFQRLYDRGNKAEYCYIHGKTDKKSSLAGCNLVLGINEYLEGERQNQDNTFVWFKKFYQRIIKETSSAYIDWLEDNVLLNKRRNKLDPVPIEIYFYGHSLDVTDKDVLNRLIMHENAKVNIFYPDKKEMAKQINNLIKVIKAENLIHMTRGKNRSIRFIPIT